LKTVLSSFLEIVIHNINEQIMRAKILARVLAHRSVPEPAVACQLCMLRATTTLGSGWLVAFRPQVET